MNTNDIYENTIFNPLFYGSSTFKKNTYGNINNNVEDDIVFFELKTYFDNNIEINGDIKFNKNSKLIFNNNDNNNFDLIKILDILKINDLENNLSKLITNHEQTKIDTNNNINSIVNNLSNLKTQFDVFSKNIEHDIQTLKYKKSNLLELNNNIILNNLDYDIYIVNNSLEITLPLITNDIVGKKIIFVNNTNKTSKIHSNIKNTINQTNQTNQNIYLLRNLNSINIIAINLNMWLFF